MSDTGPESSSEHSVVKPLVIGMFNTDVAQLRGVLAERRNHYKRPQFTNAVNGLIDFLDKQEGLAKNIYPDIDSIYVPKTVTLPTLENIAAICNGVAWKLDEFRATLNNLKRSRAEHEIFNRKMNDIDHELYRIADTLVRNCGFNRNKLGANLANRLDPAKGQGYAHGGD